MVYCINNLKVTHLNFQVCHRYERCAMCWNEWQSNFPIYAIFIFWVMVDFVHNFQVYIRPKISIFLQKWPNLHERCAMYWNEWKLNFPFFSFWDISVFLHKIGQFLMNFDYKIDHNSKNRNRKIDFSFVSVHCASFM